MCDKNIGSKIKKIFSGPAAGITGIAVLASIVFALSCCTNTYRPDTYKGEDARSRIEDYLSLPVPDSAENLCIISESWLDMLEDISMTIPPGDAWKLIRQFTGKRKRDFKKVQDEWDLPDRWRNEVLKSPLILYIYEEKHEDESVFHLHKYIIYDEGTMKLMIRLSET